MRWRSNPSGKCSQERLTPGPVTSTMRRAAHPSGCARCGAGAGCSAIKYRSLLKAAAAAAAKRQLLKSCSGRSPSSQGRNLVLTGLYLPHSLDSGLALLPSHERGLHYCHSGRHVQGYLAHKKGPRALRKNVWAYRVTSLIRNSPPP